MNGSQSLVLTPTAKFSLHLYRSRVRAAFVVLELLSWKVVFILSNVEALYTVSKLVMVEPESRQPPLHALNSEALRSPDHSLPILSLIIRHYNS